jgi:hypothetical protein
MRHRLPAAAGVWLLAQFWVNYRASPLSIDTRPFPRCRPHAGDRLTDSQVVADGRSMRLHDLLVSPGVHVLLDRDAPAVEDMLAGPEVRVHRLTSRRGHGLQVIRPDGYLGLRSAAVDLSQIQSWLALAAGRDPGTPRKSC